MSTRQGSGRHIRVFAAAAASILVACARVEPDAVLSDARQAIERNELAAAVVQLKQLLVEHPTLPEARFLLGNALLLQGDGRAALPELQRARDLDFDDEQVLPALARAYLSQGESRALTDLLNGVELKTPKARADLHASMAAAYLVQGQFESGETHLDAALRLDPKHFQARLLKVRRVAGPGKFRDCIELVDELLAEAPSDTAALILKGELLWIGMGDDDGGAAAFRRALAVEPSNVLARSLLIKLHLQRKDAEQFRAEVNELVRIAPKRVEALYYRTQLALLDGNLARASDGVPELLRWAPQDPAVLRLVGLVQLRTKDTEAAKKHLSQALAADQDVPATRRMLAGAYLESAQPEKALALLAPLVLSSALDVEAMELAAQAHERIGDVETAGQLYADLARRSPSSIKARVALALLRIERGDEQAGTAQLRDLAAHDKTQHADLALVNVLMQRSSHAAAAQAVDGLMKKTPGAALPHLLRGRLERTQGRMDAARSSLEQALKLDPGSVAVLSELALLDIAEGKLQQARQRHAELLEREPRHVEAALAMVEVRRLAGEGPRAVEDALLGLVGRYPADVSVRLALIQHHMAQRQPQRAVKTAQEAVLASPGEPRLLEALADAQLASGAPAEAVATLRRAVAMQPGLLAPLLRLAAASVAGREYDGAARTLDAALETGPHSILVQQRRLDLALLRGRSDDALRIARAVQRQHPGQVAGFRMEAEVHIERQAWPEAAAARRLVLERDPRTADAVRLHHALQAAGRANDAADFAGQWLRRMPRDTAFLFHLGNAFMERGDLPDAAGHFQRVLDLSPNHAAALNNLALVLLRQGRAPQALAQAEKANALRSDHAAIMDTLASVLAAMKQHEQALQWQRKAAAREPEKSEYRIGLARMLMTVGERQAAKLELENLAAQRLPVAEQAEVTALLKGL